VAEVRAALDWLAASGRAGRLFVGGHSAGGHLAAMMLAHPAVAGVLAISGLYDLEPIRLGTLNEKLRLTEAAARRNSPRFHLPARAPALTVAVGAAELPELIRQSADYAKALNAAGLAARYLALPGCDHFTVLDELARPEGALCEALCRMQEKR
jgi:arylformamidase